MRKVIYCLVATLMVAVLVLTSCTSAPATTTPTTTTPTTKPTTTTPTTKPTTTPTTTPTTGASAWNAIIAKEKLQDRVYGQASEGGSGYVRIGGLSQIITKYTPIRAALTVTPGTLAAVPDYISGMIDYVDLSPSQPMMLYRGEGTGQTEKVRWRFLVNGGGIASSYVGVQTTTKSGIKTAANLRGKKIGWSPGTIWTKSVTLAILKANGMTEADVTLVPAENAVNADWLAEGRIDCFVNTLGTNTVRVATELGLYIVPLTKAEQEEVTKISDYAPGVIPKGLFSAPVDTPSMQSPLALWFRAGINNITMYTLAKVFWEHVEEYYLVQDKCRGYTVENNLTAFNVPWHPGAIKYYQEMGWWTDEHTKQNMAAIERERVIFGGEVPDIEAFKALGVVK